MSHSSDSKSQVGDSNVTTTMGKIKVKTGGKKEKNVEEIMQDFLEEKDKEKWHYFVDKLGKKDSAILKWLLLSKSDDSESDGKKHPKHEHEEESESDGVRTKVPRWSERTKPQKIEDSDSDSQKLKSRRKTPVNKPSKNIKVEVIDSDSGEKKPIKKEADDTPVKKIDDVKPKIKKDKNGTQVLMKKEKNRREKRSG